MRAIQILNEIYNFDILDILIYKCSRFNVELDLTPLSGKIPTITNELKFLTFIVCTKIDPYIQTDMA